MILCTVLDSWPVMDYTNYSCYCGLGGSGTPDDELDSMMNGFPSWTTATLNYRATAVTRPATPVTCLNDIDSCEKFICECDLKAANVHHKGRQ
ncbi:phospholipase A2, minor isoenzyme-like [Thunnus maccoyii]|uniref:phospholipase A2, minor isoenzyme-like n=1 Tax=Thunnus maccoyii TaxID=8240 RepID=UPI001C4D6E00|nr:phospholipase A2, minor isoenzyme-like [Thunnus maccoyii]